MPIAVERVLLVLAVLLLAYLALDIVGGWLRRRRDERALQQLAGEHKANGRSGDGNGGNTTAALEDTAIATAGPVERSLAMAGLAIDPTLFVLGLIVLGAVTFISLFDSLPIPWVAALAGGLLVAFIPYALVREWGLARARNFEEKLVDAVDIMISALQGGENPEQALATTASVSDGVIRREFAEVSERLRVGMPVRRAFARMIRRYDSEGVQLLTQTLAVKWQSGGDLAQILRSVNAVMRDRLRHRLHLRSQLAGAQLSAILIALFPYILIPVFFYLRPEWYRTLINNPLGPQLLFGAIVLQVIGFLWLRRILRIEL